ncbi:putative transporter MCH4 [Wickerhamomyces ciferrii]|uniref:Transporter MCH4 n=1 Tax=Wickerhamomyces ciferrii (strain ATCC 14091 / BCRC 22168 / CBS 111 / JCM 3599 / NBRC 0793 / NRRL Y-1031 F-60-10) TaxID=1206466 RepID=K0KM50_WICCF|nr:putative transporter MCH4 [Wickerhamomyces ciferrii]CCH44076.1 putative transporter MCH4 [Wickerhamomyces ciferrii]
MSLPLPQPSLKKVDRYEAEKTIELNTIDTNNSLTGIGSKSTGIVTGSGFTKNPSTGGEGEGSDHQPETHELNEDEIPLVNEDLEFPEGGLQAYLVVFGSFMGLVPVFGLINSAGAIENYVASHQLSALSPSSVSWIFSLNIFIQCCIGVFSGSIFDKHGSRILLSIGSVFFCGGLFATGNCKTVYQFVLAYGVVNGFGSGLMMSPLVSVVSHYFKKKRATYVSIASIGGSVGGIVMPLMLRALYPKVGFAWAMRCLAFICMFSLIFPLIFAKERIRNVAKVRNVSHLPLHKRIFHSYIKDVFDYKLLFEVKFIFCALAVALAESSLIICSIYFPSYTIMRGYGENTSYLLLTVINSAGILGRYLPGYIADKFLGSFNVAMITLSGCVILSLALWLPFGYSLKVLYTYAAFYGLCSGSILSISPSCCGQISRTDEFGKRYSTMFLMAALAMLGLLPLGGAIIGDGTVRHYNNFIVYLSMLTVGAICCYGVSRYSVVGFKLCKF